MEHSILEMKYSILAAAMMMTLMGPIVLQSVTASHVSGHIFNHNWDLFYASTTHDGLQIDQAFHKGSDNLYKRVLHKGSLQYIIVQYRDGPGTLFFDHLCSGTSGQPPAPYGTGSTCIAKTSGPTVSTTGFISIKARYGTVGTTTYTYDQEWQFHPDGKMISTIRYFGPGLYPNSNGISDYFFHYRMDHDIDVITPNIFMRFDSNVWSKKTVEHNYPANGAYSSSGHEWKQRYQTSTREYLIVPNPGDDVSGNRPKMWALQYAANQWDGGAATTQEPSAFDNDASIDGQDLVTWYIPKQVFNTACKSTSTTADCTSGFRENKGNW